MMIEPNDPLVDASDEVLELVCELQARIEALEGALREAREALCDYACHAENAPCLRSPDQCQTQCGKTAGDAILNIDSILSNKGDSDRAAALSELAENDAYILDHENADLKARGIE